MLQLIAWLSSIWEPLPWVLFTALVWISVWALRRYLPSFWRWTVLLPLRDHLIASIPPAMLPQLVPVVERSWNVVQALPSLLAGAVFAAYQSGGDIGEAWKGALITALAPVIHHVRKALPFDPYVGAVGRTPKASAPSTLAPRRDSWGAPPLATIAMLCALPCAFLVSCAAFGGRDATTPERVRAVGAMIRDGYTITRKSCTEVMPVLHMLPPGEERDFTAAVCELFVPKAEPVAIEQAPALAPAAGAGGVAGSADAGASGLGGVGGRPAEP